MNPQPLQSTFETAGGNYKNFQKADQLTIFGRNRLFFLEAAFGFVMTPRQE
jgi:hypothetical protein